MREDVQQLWEELEDQLEFVGTNGFSGLILRLLVLVLGSTGSLLSRAQRRSWHFSVLTKPCTNLLLRNSKRLIIYSY